MDLMKNTIGTSRNIPSAEWDFMGNLKEMRLEALSVEFYGGDNAVLLEFLLQNGSTLKSLALKYCGVSDGMLGVICESLKNLEQVNLGGEFEDFGIGLIAIRNLTKLKKFSTLSVLEIFTAEVNETMLEIKAPFRGKTTNFIARLGACLPNMRNLCTGVVSAPQIEAIMLGFPHLKAFVMHPDEEMLRHSGLLHHPESNR